MLVFHVQTSRRLGRLWRLIVCLVLAGCSRGARDLHFDETVARESLVAFLETWKKGEPPAAMRSRSPEVIVGDVDWESGMKLKMYHLVEPSSDDGANMHAGVELFLQDKRGRVRQQLVTYIIGTSPVITIFRK